MRKMTLYSVHPDRAVERSRAKTKLADYLDTKGGRWFLEQRHIFHNEPLETFETWDEFLKWQPAPVPPKKPAVLVIEGDVLPQSPLPMTDEEFAIRLARTPQSAAQDLMTQVGTMDSSRTILFWAMAGVMAACAVAILFMVVVAAASFLSPEPDRPQPPQLAPAMQQPAEEVPAAPQPWFTTTTPEQ